MAGTETKQRIGKQDIREFADGVIQKLDAQAAGAPPQDGVQAHPLPGFEDGKATLQDGKPVVPDAQAKPPQFTDGTKRDLPPEPASKDAGITPPAQQQPSPASPSPAGVAAAESAAQAAIEELEEFEFDEPDLGIKVPIKYPKKYGDVVKRGYGKRSALDRELTYFKEVAPTLRPLVADGRMRAVLPLLQRALEDQEYGEFVTQAYQRRLRGEPLVQQAMREAEAAHDAAARVAPAAPSPEEAALLADPFLAEQIKPFQQQFESRLSQMQARLDAAEQARQRAEQQQTTAHQQQLENDRAMREAHADLTSMFDGQFNARLGPQDPMWQRACEYARDAGYIQRYGLKAGIIFGGQQAMAIERERIAATSSPAAAALAQTDQALAVAAQREAARSAGAAAGGAASASVPPTLRAKPIPRDAAGNLRDKDEFMADMAAWLQEKAALAQSGRGA